jgi:Cytochrome bd terminal oxidase subunit II
MDPVWLANFWVGVIAFAILAYVILDGYDLGVGILFGTTANEQHRVTMMNAIAPYWDGNETWLVLVGAGLFAAFPMVYAIFLPAFYLPVALMLLGLIFRGVAFEFRYRSTRMRPVWDLGFFLGSLVAAFVQGAAIGTMVQELTVIDGHFAGGPFEWVTPFSVLCGIGLVLGYALLGAAWLVLKTEGDLRDWARRRHCGADRALRVRALHPTAGARSLARRPAAFGAAPARCRGHGRPVARGALAARWHPVHDGYPRGGLRFRDVGGQLLAVHDPVFGHSAAGGRPATIPRVPVLGRGHRRVPRRSYLHRICLLDLSRQGDHGRTALLAADRRMTQTVPPF